MRSSSKLRQQGRIVHGLRIGGDGIAEADIDLDRAAGIGKQADQSDADSAVARFLANLGGTNGLGLKPQAVFWHDGHRAQLPENGLQHRLLSRAESQQVDIAGRAMGNVEPEVEEQGPFEQESLAMRRRPEPIEQSLQGVTGEDEIESCPVALALSSSRARTEAPTSGPLMPGSPDRDASHC